jgi:hypothetical protein
MQRSILGNGRPAVRRTEPPVDEVTGAAGDRIRAQVRHWARRSLTGPDDSTQTFIGRLEKLLQTAMFGG